jgi:hypothetical protein
VRDPNPDHLAELQSTVPKQRRVGILLVTAVVFVVAFIMVRASGDRGEAVAFRKRGERATTTTSSGVTSTSASPSSTTSSSSSSTSTTARPVVSPSTSSTRPPEGSTTTTTTTAPASGENYIGIRYQLGEPPPEYTGGDGLRTPILVDGRPLPGLEAQSGTAIGRVVHPDDRPLYMIQEVRAADYNMWWFVRLDGPNGPGRELLVLDVLVEPPHSRPELEMFPFNCQRDGAWEPHIVALVHRTEYQTRAWNRDVRTAWVFDITTEKIDPLPTPGVECMS